MLARLLALFVLGLPFAAAQKPNIVFVFIDDMGYGDLSVTGNRDVHTPHIDRLADEGILFEQFYVASPICSPSRVGITTGQYPARHLIHSYLNNRRRNRERGMRDFLDPNAPAIARVFHDAGYATAHFGKWHMGGGRDVDDAPLPQAYGFDESLTSFEGLGDRILPPGRLADMSASLGRGKILRVAKYEQTPIYIDRSIDFIKRNQENPFYLHLWLNDVHDAHNPVPEALPAFSHFKNPYLRRFYAVLTDMDRQIGRLVEAIDQNDLAEQTLIVVTSDNGPTAWPRYYEEGHDPPGSTAGFRGRKWSLYEGGIRMPLIVRWTGRIPPGRRDPHSVLGSVDFFPTFCALAGVRPPEEDFDGLDRSKAFLGEPQPTREKPLIWEYGRDRTFLQPFLKDDRSPNLAIRDGRWKLLVNADGSGLELYDFESETAERNDVASAFPSVAKRLSEQLLAWRRALPTIE